MITKNVGALKMNDEYMIIYWWHGDDGSKKYRCSGTGKKYTDFYRNWIPQSSYRCTSSDWPWDFFVFDNPDDHAKLIQAYPEDVWQDEE